MAFYWGINSVPELDGLDKAEKRKRYREMYKHGRKRLGKQPWFTLLALLIAVVLVIAAIGITGAAASGIAGGLMGFAVVVLIQNPAIDHGRAWYRETYGADGPET